MTRYTGGCLCGAVRYSVDAEPLPGRQLLCHCVDCQKHTGTAFLSAMAFPSDAVAITGTMTPSRCQVGKVASQCIGDFARSVVHRS